MDLSFYPLTLDAVDQADAEALCLFVAEDERPLTGLAGLADWRLSGRLSRMIRSGMLTGGAGEAVLTPPGARLAFKKLFLFGLGKAQTDDELAARLKDALRRLAQAGVQDAALQFPPRLPPEVGVRTLVEDVGTLLRALVFAAEPGKLVTALSQAAGAPQVERRVVKVPLPTKATPPPRTRPHRPATTSTPSSKTTSTSNTTPTSTEPAPPPRPPPPPPQRYVPPPPKEQAPKKKRH